MKIFYLFFALYIFANVYIFLEIRRWLGPGLWQWPAALWFVAMIVLWALRFGLPSAGMMGYAEDVGFVWIGFIMITLLCFVVADMAALGLKVTSLFTDAPFTRSLQGSRRVCLALLAGVLLSLYATYEAQGIKVRHYTIETDRLPAGQDRLRIAMLTDLHISDFIGPRMLNQIAALVKTEQPDMLVVVGDIVDSDVSKNVESAEILAGISAPAGKFAVTGNHEAYRGLEQSITFIERSDLKLLRNEMVNAGGITVAGIDDITVTEHYGGEPDPAPLLKGYSGENFVLLLKHRPTGMNEAKGLFDLQLSGHTHGGQIWPGKYIVKMLHDDLPQGLTEFEKKNGRQGKIIISNGTGFWGPPMRLFTPPEIIIINLVNEHQGG